MDLLSKNDPNAVAIAPNFSYGQLDHLTARAVGGLSLQGLKKNDLIILRSQNNWETICLIFAAWRLSLTVLLLPPHLPQAAIQKLFLDLKPTLFIDNPTPFFLNKEDDHKDTTDAAFLMLTSGSSGTPKIAAFSQSQLFESAETVSLALSLKPQDRWLLSLPLYHVGGLGAVLRTFYSGGTVVFEDKNLSLLDRILSAKPQFASLVPTHLHRLLKEEFNSLSTHFLIGGAPLSFGLYKKALAKGLNPSLTYGLTEMCSTVLLTTNPTWANELPYLGHPLPRREISIHPNSEILVRGAPLFNGYGFPPTPPSTWFATGDLGNFHEEHGFTIYGRKDFQFISGGENIQPEEIEALLLSHPLVEQAMIVPVPHEEFGARPIALVQTTLSTDELIKHLALYLPKYKIPIAFLPMKEALIQNGGLKPNRRQLIDRINQIYPFMPKPTSL